MPNDHSPDGPKAVAQVTVVIPTYNRAADLERTLHSLAAQTVGEDLRAVVVDNSSTDGTGEVVARIAAGWQGRLGYLRKEPNGPASARNAGLALVRTPFVAFIDSDVELPAAWVERGLAHLGRAPALGAIGGYILYAFDITRVNAYGGDLGRTGLAWDVDEGCAVDTAKGPAERVWINCSAMLARTDAVREAGGFDETFFIAYEDSDLGWRLNLMGHGVSVFPDLVACHHVEADPGASQPEFVFHYCKNRLRSILKNASTTQLPVMLAAYGAYSLVDVALRGPRGAKLRAVAWNARHLGETLAMRRAIQVKRVVADSKVFDRGSRRWLPPTALGGRRRRPLVAAEPPQSPGHAVPSESND